MECKIILICDLSKYILINIFCIKLTTTIYRQALANSELILLMTIIINTSIITSSFKLLNRNN